MSVAGVEEENTANSYWSCDIKPSLLLWQFMEKSLTGKMTRLVFCIENVQGYIMLNLLLLEAILYLHVFSHQ